MFLLETETQWSKCNKRNWRKTQTEKMTFINLSLSDFELHHRHMYMYIKLMWCSYWLTIDSDGQVVVVPADSTATIVSKSNRVKLQTAVLNKWWLRRPGTVKYYETKLLMLSKMMIAIHQPEKVPMIRVWNVEPLLAQTGTHSSHSRSWETLLETHITQTVCLWSLLINTSYHYDYDYLL